MSGSSSTGIKTHGGDGRRKSPSPSPPTAIPPAPEPGRTAAPRRSGYGRGTEDLSPTLAPIASSATTSKSQYNSTHSQEQQQQHQQHRDPTVDGSPPERLSHSPSPPPSPPVTHPIGSGGAEGVPAALPSGSHAMSASVGARATSSELYSLQSPSPDPSGNSSGSAAGTGGAPLTVPSLPLFDASSQSNPRSSSLQETSPAASMPPLQPAALGAGIPTPSPSPPINLSTTTTGSLPNTSSPSSASSPSPASSGSFSSNPRRTFNPAFLTLSPRAESEGSQGSEASLEAAVLRLETDKGHTKEVVQLDMTNLEDRKVFVTQQCAALAKHMSATRIVESLLPALLTAFECDDYSESFDNCGPSIAAVLPKLVESLDDRSTDKMKYFIGLIMELCCSAENTVLRDITTSLQKIIALLDDGVVADLFLPLVLSMRVSFWSTPRAVAAGLLGCLASRPAVVRASEMSVATWFNCFVESSRDPCVLVREAAVKALHHWIAVADAHGVSHVELPLPLVKEFVTDDLSDTVRYLLVQELVRLAKCMGREATSKHLQVVYASACGDPSWRVRFIAAQCMGDLFELVAKPESFVRVLALLAEDEEPEIRAAVARQIPRIAETLPGDTVELRCVPIALRLGEDIDPIVRGAAVHGYAPLLVLDSEEVARTVCDGVVHLMEDPTFAVQVEAIRSLEHIIQVLENSVLQADARATDDDASSSSLNRTTTSVGSASGRRKQKSSQGTLDRHTEGNSAVASGSSSSRGGGGAGGPRRLGSAAARERVILVVQAFVTRLESMSDAGNWRLRDAVVYILRFFCRAIREEDFTPLTHVIRVLLRDPVSEVRSRAIETLKVVAEHYGAEWAAQTTTVLLHSEFAPAKQQTYVWRLVAIQCLAVLLPVVSGLAAADLRRLQLLNLTTELLQQYACDSVPNVRMTLARAMPRWHGWFSSSTREQLVYNDAVARLQQDKDIDVALAAAAVTTIHGDEVPAVTGSATPATGLSSTRRDDVAAPAGSFNEFTTPY